MQLIEQIAAPTTNYTERKEASENAIAAVRRQFDENGERHKALIQSVDALKSSIAMAESQIPTSDLANTRDWHRPGHVGTFWCGATVDVTSDELLVACSVFSPLLE